MFKKYRFKWKDGDGERSVDFYVHSKGTRSGFDEEPRRRAICGE